MLFFQFNNSILSKLLIQHPAIAFDTFCSFWSRLFCNSCCSFWIVDFYQSRQSIVVLGVQVSTWGIEYAAPRHNNCWCSVDTRFHGSVMQMSFTDLPRKAAITMSSAICKSVWKPHANFPDTTVDLTSASKYFQILPGPPGARHSAVRLCQSILRCFRKHLQLWRCIQDTLICDL
jgi:hypothetical protein